MERVGGCLTVTIVLIVVMFQTVSAETSCSDEQYYDTFTNTCRVCDTCENQRIFLIPCKPFANTVCSEKLIWLGFFKGMNTERHVTSARVSTNTPANTPENTSDTWNYPPELEFFLGCMVTISICAMVVGLYVSFKYRQQKLMQENLPLDIDALRRRSTSANFRRSNDYVNTALLFKKPNPAASDVSVV